MRDAIARYYQVNERHNPDFCINYPLYLFWLFNMETPTIEKQIKQCQKPDRFYHIGYSNAELKREQFFCSTCERWKWKSQQCKLFKEGVQFQPTK